MGVKGLWSLLNPVARPVQIESLEGKRLAIDSSIWLYQFQSTMRDKDGRVLVNAHVLGFLRRINKLLFHGIRPVFVFDGGAPVLKKSTIAERKRKKSGAAVNHAKMAEKLLQAQMRREALRVTQEAQAARAARAAQEAYIEEGGEIMPDNPVYLDQLENPGARSAGPSTERSQPKDEAEARRKKFKKYDRYYLPETTMPSFSTDDKPDARLATEEELAQFIDEVNPEDIDIESPEFRALPTEVQYEIIGDLRVRSRQQSHKRLTEMLRAAPTALDFSKAQIKHLSQRNALTQQLLTVTDMVGSAHLTIPVRVAAERNRQYVLVKRGEEEGGGWALGIREGTKERPIVLEPETKPVVKDEDSDMEGSDSDASDIEEYQPPMDNDLRQHRRREILSAIAARYAPVSSKPSKDEIIKPFGRARAPDAAPLFDAVEEDVEEEEVVEGAAALDDVITANDEALALALQQEELGSDEDEADPDLARALALSRRAAEVKTAAAGDSSDDEELEEVSLAPSGAATPEPIVVDSDSEDDVVEVTGDTLPSRSAVAEPPAAPKNPPALLNALRKDSVSAKEPTPLTSTKTAGIRVRNGGRQAGSGLAALVARSRPQNQVPTPTVQAPVISTARPPVSKAPTPPIAVPRRDPSPPSQAVESEEDDEFEEVATPGTPSHTQSMDLGTANEATVEAPKPARRPASELVAAARPRTKSPSVSPSPSPSLVPDELDEQEVSRFRGAPSPSPPQSRALSPGLEEVTEQNTLESTLPATRPASHYDDDSEDEEEPIEWSRSPTPERRHSPLQRVHSVAQSTTSEPEAEDEDMQPADMVNEEDDYARFLAQIKNRDLDEVRGEIDDEIRVLNQQNKAAMRDSDEITQAMVGQIQTLLRHFGIPYITAPMEAEAQCAKLAELDLVDGIITDDSDVFLFGGTQCFKNIFNDAKYAECFLATDVERELSLTRERLISLSYLLGSDYTIGLPGIGPVMALELLANFPGPDGLMRFKEWWLKVQRGTDLDVEADTKWKRSFKKRFADSIMLTAAWPDPHVREAYLYPTADESKEPFHWGFPRLAALRTYLHEELSWSISKVDDELTPIVQRIAKRGRSGALITQPTLLNFFDNSAAAGVSYAPRRRTTANMSKRLMSVIKQFREAEALVQGQQPQGWGEMLSGVDESDPKGRGSGMRSRVVTDTEVEGEEEEGQKKKRTTGKRKSATTDNDEPKRRKRQSTSMASESEASEAPTRGTRNK